MELGGSSPAPGRRSLHEKATTGQGGRRRVRGAAQLAAAVLPPVLTLLVLLIAVGNTTGEGANEAWSKPWLLLLWCLAATAATLYRPFSDRPSLGWGAIVIAPLLFLHGSAPAALAAGIAVLAGDLAYRVVKSSLGITDDLPLAPVFERSMLSVFSVLVAAKILFSFGGFNLGKQDGGKQDGGNEVPGEVGTGGVSTGEISAGEIGTGGISTGEIGAGEIVYGDPSWGALFWATPLIYFACLVLSTLALDWLRHERWSPKQVLQSAALDVAAWLVGAGLLVAAHSGGWREVGWMWPVLALFAAEAGRLALLRQRADQRLSSYERLHRAHERILAESSGMGGIAEQVLIECRNILPLQWFQFELPAAAGTGSGAASGSDSDGGPGPSWAAGPDGHLVEGRPHPPQRPQMLPGIHRRATWKVLERELIQQTPEGEDETLATLRLWCDPRRLEPGAESLLETLLPQMAASVHRARLDREARLDPLTGVPVRRVLEAGLQRSYRRACDDGTPMAVIMCDIDFFKRVNDTWGHDAGDEALKLVASTLDATRRDGDLCCRYGGEEFTVLLERTDGLAALQLAERLRRAVEALQFVYDGQSIPLTLSLGVAAFPEVMIKTASELQLLADEALYECKERGRNQSLLNVGNGAFLAPPGVPRQESSTTVARPVFE